MSNLYCAILTKKEVNVIKDSLKLCMDAILCSNYIACKKILNDIETVMNHSNEKNDRIMSNLYYAAMTKEEVDVIIESFKTSLDIIEYKMSSAEFDANYDDMYYCELRSEYAKYETTLINIEIMLEYNEDNKEE